MPPLRVLVVNPGSSSLKLSLLGGDDAVLAASEVDRPREDDRGGFEDFLAAHAGAFDAAAVRVVHGGSRFRRSVVVDADVVAELEAISDLAPLHNPPAVRALRRLLAASAGRPVVACFDTAFHATLPDAAAVYAVPWRWTSEYGTRRYGFHGLSHAWASRRAAVVLGRDLSELSMVTCHLGAGASLAAVRGGVSVDTTMGFTPMDGLVMATRSGSVDPGLLLWIQQRHGVSAADAERMLDRESGLLGLSGVSGDMREVLSAAARGVARAQLAVDVYVHRLRASIAAMAASLERLDALVFTGGVGENAASIREQVCAGLGILGVPGGLPESAEPAVSDAAGQSPASGEDRPVSPPGSRVAVLVVRAREDRQIALEVRTLLA
ncbi:MAG TPA: acetate/propionate family kinase [Candidatus Dormibacteraeota bacterium]|nr:acetate/propionate family kinase [Candidatus Dormibacteraeota bacterium]